MKYILTFLILLMVITAAKSQHYTNRISKDSVTMVAYFNKKDKHKYHVVVTDGKYKSDGTPEAVKKREYDVTFTVLDSSEKSYTMELVYSALKVAAGDSVEAELARIVAGCKIIYQIDEFGSFNSILNKKEISAALNKGIAAATAKLDTKYKDTALRELVRSSLNGTVMLIRDENNIDAFFGDDIFMLHGYYGMVAVRNRKLSAEITYPVLSDLVIKGYASIGLTNIDEVAKTCQFTITESPDEAEKAAIMSEALPRILPAVGGSADMNLFKLDAKTQRILVMDLYTGWLRKIQFERKADYNYNGRAGKFIVNYSWTRVF